MEIDQAILAIRAVLHFATFCVLFNYRDPAAKPRPWVSVLAILLAAPSLAMALYILATWGQRAVTTSQIIESGLITLMAGALFVSVWLAGGNVARLLPRRVWSHR